MSSFKIRLSLHCLGWLLVMVSTVYQSAAALEQPILYFPINGARLPTSGSVSFFWYPAAGAESYEITVWINEQIRVQRQTTATSLSVDLSPKPEDYNAPGRWSVKAIQGDSSFESQVFSFTLVSSTTPTPASTPQITPTPVGQPSPTTKPFQLPAPDLISPLDGEIISEQQAALGIAFSWKNVTGASRYQLRIYEDNAVLVYPETTDTRITYPVTNPIQQTYEWDVRAIGFNALGVPSQRRSFVVGVEFYPTPTAAPITADQDQNNAITAQDVYQYAARFRSKISHPNFDDPSDLLNFIERFKASSNP